MKAPVDLIIRNSPAKVRSGVMGSRTRTLEPAIPGSSSSERYGRIYGYSREVGFSACITAARLAGLRERILALRRCLRD